MARATPLAITLSSTDPRPIAKQIADQVRLAITTGDLARDARLPSVRALAAQLLVNANTVAKAYAELAGEGWVHGQHGQGMFVAGLHGALSDTEKERRLAKAVDLFVAEIVAIGFDPAAARTDIDAALDSLAARKVA